MSGLDELSKPLPPRAKFPVAFHLLRNCGSWVQVVEVLDRLLAFINGFLESVGELVELELEFFMLLRSRDTDLDVVELLGADPLCLLCLGVLLRAAVGP